jgi:1-aminocyclopropane-1-carboxylate deaminase/D-cysteine desulfhydrase-like pyridoxal-dependent ACC family enzyme
MSEPALFRVLPRARDHVPHLPLGTFPTPVERVAGLVPESVELWVKREDRAGERYGGNKVRKLEFMLGEAHARGRRQLLTFGGYGAHHVTATALYGAALGFDVEAILFPQAVDAHVRELLLTAAAAGARLVPARSLAAALLSIPRARLASERYWLAGGGSSVTGTLGWVSGAFELLEQVRAGALPPFDVVYAALGSAGTVAGLVAGLRASRAIEVAAIRVVDSWMCGAGAVRRLQRGVERRLSALGQRLDGAPARLRIETRFAGRYGQPTAASQEATNRARSVGLALEPIYTGKVLAALLTDARTGRLAGKRVLLLHSASGVDLGPWVERACLATLAGPLRTLCAPSSTARAPSTARR